jgi:hypothetical protein
VKYMRKAKIKGINVRRFLVELQKELNVLIQTLQKILLLFVIAQMQLKFI